MKTYDRKPVTFKASTPDTVAIETIRDHLAETTRCHWTESGAVRWALSFARNEIVKLRNVV
jgi:hypothetical protein